MYANEQPRRSKSAMLSRLDAKPATAKLAARNTLDYTDAAGVRRIRLHDTDILTIKPDGGFVVDTGGWATTTTCARLREFLPSGYRIHRERGRMHLNGIPFRQTVTVSAHGGIVPDITPTQDAALTKLIDRYMAAYRKRGLPRPEESGGDPWIFTKGKVDAEIMMDWLRSRYVFRKLYLMALDYAGITEHGQHYMAAMADSSGMDATAYRRIRRYIRACLGLTA